ncbi:hypothetical protein ACHAW6_006407 [Cyclotella cf. meneghiniana]
MRVTAITVEFLPRRTAKLIGMKLTWVLQLYSRAGFVVQTALMDKKFDAVADQCPSLPINTTAANKHVPKIEQTQGIATHFLSQSCRSSWQLNSSIL